MAITLTDKMATVCTKTMGEKGDFKKYPSQKTHST